MDRHEDGLEYPLTADPLVGHVHLEQEGGVHAEKHHHVAHAADPGVPRGRVRGQSFGDDKSEGDHQRYRDLRRRVGVDEHYHAGKQNPPAALNHLVVEYLRRVRLPQAGGGIDVRRIFSWLGLFTLQHVAIPEQKAGVESRNAHRLQDDHDARVRLETPTFRRIALDAVVRTKVLIVVIVVQLLARERFEQGGTDARVHQKREQEHHGHVLVLDDFEALGLSTVDADGGGVGTR